MPEFEHIICQTCGIHFGLEPRRSEDLRITHRDFYCPNGHALSYKDKSKSEKELEALRAEVKELSSQLKAAQEEVSLQKEKVNMLTMELEIWKPSDRVGQA